jgi:hypothetical protein
MRIATYFITILLLINIIETAQAQNDVPASPVEVHTITAPNIDLVDLVEGASGTAYILLYQPDRGIERPALVVRLSKLPDAETATAEVYGAPLELNYVPIRIEGDEVVFEQESQPVVRMTALGGWWVRDGRTNYNLDIQINGPVSAMWGTDYDPKSGPQGWAAEIEPGSPASRITVRDRDEDGIPDWDLRQLIPEFPNRGYLRVNYAERMCASPLEIDPGILPLWPFVGVSGGFEQPVAKLLPPIILDPEQARVTHFSELVTVRNQNCSYSLYSIKPFAEGVINRADFETPFAFYDLSEQGVGHPNLLIRTQRSLTGYQFSGNFSGRDMERIRYSWRNDIGDWDWDYKIEVQGFYDYGFETPIADSLFTIDAPDYDVFPGWVIERPWPAVTFVDTEDTQYLSSEGIYDFSPEIISREYLLGGESVADINEIEALSEGLRGEYRFEQNSLPLLYFSPIDNRLHLLEAEAGLWRINPEQVLRVSNLGGKYINAWIRERSPARINEDDPRLLQDDGATSNENKPLTAIPAPAPSVIEATLIEESLYALPEHLLYSNPDQVVLVQADYQSELFTIAPPVDHETWQSFRDRIEPLRAEKRDPYDLRSWLEPYRGPTQMISGARIDQVRLTPSGFRFLLELQPRYRVDTPDLFELQGLAPGRYVVRYDGRFTIEAVTPPQLAASFRSTTPAPGERHTLQVSLTNSGLQDISAATLAITARMDSSDHTLEFSRTVNLLAGDTINPTFEWSPDQTGVWELTTLVRLSDGSAIELEPDVLTIDTINATADPGQVAASTGSMASLPAGLILLTCSILGMLVLTSQFRLVEQRLDDE